MQPTPLILKHQIRLPNPNLKLLTIFKSFSLHDLFTRCKGNILCKEEVSTMSCCCYFLSEKMFSVLMQIRLFDKISREKSENQNGARSIWFMSSERIFAQDFNSTRIIALSYLFPEIGPKIKIRSLSLPFPLMSMYVDAMGSRLTNQRWRKYRRWHRSWSEGQKTGKK